MKRRNNFVVEWTLGLAIPVFVAGLLCEPPSVYMSRSNSCVVQDYVVQGARFAVEEGFGCVNSLDGSVLSILLLNSWAVVPPLISIVFYYRECISRMASRNSLTIPSL